MRTSVASVRLLMPLAILCFRSKSISVIVVSIILKLAYLYKLTEKKRLIYMHLLLLSIMWLTRTSRKKKIDSSRIWSSVYIISKKKRPVYMHIVIYIVILVVFCGLPGPQEKDDSARRIWMDIIFSQHKGNEHACALHPKE